MSDAQFQREVLQELRRGNALLLNIAASLRGDDEEEPACPGCGVRGKLEDTSESTFGEERKRVTCLACGDSFATIPEREEVSVG